MFNSVLIYRRSAAAVLAAAVAVAIVALAAAGPSASAEHGFAEGPGANGAPGFGGAPEPESPGPGADSMDLVLPDAAEVQGPLSYGGVPVVGEFKRYAHTDLSGTSIYSVPRDLRSEFNVAFGELHFQVTRAGSATADEAVALGDGVYYTDHANSVGTYTTQLDGGSNIILELLGNSTAPTSYEYAVDLPEGFALELNSEGGADVVDEFGIATDVSVAAPWAYDSNGVPVPVSYAVGDDNVLEFTVDHLSGDYAYPIVADPCWDFSRGRCGQKILGAGLIGGLGGATSGIGAPIGAVAGSVLCMIICDP